MENIIYLIGGLIVGFLIGSVSVIFFKKKDIQNCDNKIFEEKEEIDSLTNLPNRAEFFKNIHKIKGVILFDLDDFSIINSVYSREVGDEVLQKLSKKIANHKDIKKLYRMGGDEFAIIFEEEKDLKPIAHEIAKIIDEFYLKKDNILIQIGATIAISYQSPFIETADLALKYGKKKKLNIVIYSENLGLFQADEAFVDIIRRIKIAIRENNIVPFFQCIKDKNEKIVQYEALMRIKEGDKFLTPAIFLDVAKSTKLYSELTIAMIQNTFEYMKDKNITFSINLSYDDIFNNRLYKFILKRIDAFPNPKNIIIELLETESIKNFDYVKGFIEDIRSRGCQIAIDDFGNGYNNFVYLEKLNPDIIKIDGSLVQKILSSDNAAFLIQTIINFCKKNNIKCVAEYVSHREIYLALKDMDVDEYQGFYFCKPKENVE